MSSKGTLARGDYTQQVVAAAEANQDFVMGYISGGSGGGKRAAAGPAAGLVQHMCWQWWALRKAATQRMPLQHSSGINTPPFILQCRLQAGRTGRAHQALST
jgi:hypothetical protein